MARRSRYLRYDEYVAALVNNIVQETGQKEVVKMNERKTVGFTPLEGFYSQKNHLRTLEDMLEQNDNMLDGVVNNIPEETMPCKCEKKKESVLEQLNGMREKETSPFFGLKLPERNRE